LVHILDLQGVPRFFRPVDRTMLKGFQSLADYAPGVARPLVEAPIRHLPLFDEDLEAAPPAEVVAFQRIVESANGVLIITPEYNHSIPGVLKNAMDWGSRKSTERALVGKPAAIMGVSSGLSGAVRAQAHLRQLLATLNMPGLTTHDVVVRDGAAKFDADGTLIDPQTREHVEKNLAAFAAWIRLLNGAA